MLAIYERFGPRSAAHQYTDSRKRLCVMPIRSGYRPKAWCGGIVFDMMQHRCFQKLPDLLHFRLREWDALQQHNGEHAGLTLYFAAHGLQPLGGTYKQKS